MRERRIKTCFKYIILFSIFFLSMSGNSYGTYIYPGLTEEFADCFWQIGPNYSYRLLKGQTITPQYNPLVTYTAPETGSYRFFAFDGEFHRDSWDSLDPSQDRYTVVYCVKKSPPLELDAWPSNYVWRYIGQFTVSYDYGVNVFLERYYSHRYGWEAIAVYFYTKKQDCEVSINISPSEVWPKGAGNDDKTTATIMVTATNPPPEGCTINFKVEPVENSGGHSHHDDSRRKGTVTPPTLTIPAGSLEPVYALYSSSDISGQEKIIVEVNGSKADEKMIEVKVPDLMPLDSLSWYNLTGADAISSHPANHYGTNSTKVAVYNMASDYWNEIRTRLGINDMSLEWGGLFDVNENWSSPHSLHRTGESVDIDRCADGVLVNQKRLDKIALRYDGERIVEEALRPPPCSGPADTPRIHYEF